MVLINLLGRILAVLGAYIFYSSFSGLYLYDEIAWPLTFGGILLVVIGITLWRVPSLNEIKKQRKVDDERLQFNKEFSLSSVAKLSPSDLSILEEHDFIPSLHLLNISNFSQEIAKALIDTQDSDIHKNRIYRSILLTREEISSLDNLQTRYKDLFSDFELSISNIVDELEAQQDDQIKKIEKKYNDKTEERTGETDSKLIPDSPEYKTRLRTKKNEIRKSRDEEILSIKRDFQKKLGDIMNRDSANIPEDSKKIRRMCSEVGSAYFNLLESIRNSRISEINKYLKLYNIQEPEFAFSLDPQSLTEGLLLFNSTTSHFINR